MFPFAVCCFLLFPLLVLVFEIESVLSQKPKQSNAIGCLFWLFIARFGVLYMSPSDYRIARFGFLLV